MIEFGAARLQSRTTSTGNASPQNKLSRKCGYKPGLSSPSRRMNTAVEGTENQTVSRESFRNAPGLINCFWLGQHTHAPLCQATNMSCADKSKVRSKFWEARSLLVDRKSTRLNSSHRCISYAVF